MKLVSADVRRGRRNRRTFLVWLFASFVFAGTSVLIGASEDIGRYRYGSNLWEEAPNDARTMLLLHFGRPQLEAGLDLVAEGLVQRKAEELEVAEDAEMQAVLDNETGDNGLGDLLNMGGGEKIQLLSPLGKKKAPPLPPVDEPEIPSDTVFDYSDARRTIKLGAGIKVIPDGRFGAGVQLDGRGPGVKILDDNETSGWGGIGMVDCWIKVSAYPVKPACIFSVGGDEGRLLLRADGRLEFKRRKPHGLPDPKRQTPEELAQILATPGIFASDARLPLNVWTHVAVGLAHVAQVDSHIGWIWMNGEVVAEYQSTPNNWYYWFNGYGKDKAFVIGNRRKGDEPFVGCMDELRLSRGQLNFATPSRFFNTRVVPDWIDSVGKREPQFDQPYFLQDGTVFYASFEKGLAFDQHVGGVKELKLNRRVLEPGKLLTDGIRGRGFVVNPQIAIIDIPTNGLSLGAGSLEFWIRPVNWDNADVSTPKKPTVTTTILRFYIVDPDDLTGERLYFSLPIPRTHNADRGGPWFHPGVWNHLCLVWDAQAPDAFLLYRNHEHRWVRPQSYAIAPQLRKRNLDPKKLTLTRIELGIGERALGADGREPIVIVDEVVAYDYALTQHEVSQAYRRAQQVLDPIRLYERDWKYKYDLGQLTYTLEPLLPPETVAVNATVSLYAKGGSTPVRGPVTASVIDEKAVFDMGAEDFVPHGDYEFRVRAVDVGGRVVLEGTDDWHFAREVWRGNTLGILTEAPEPWTPIKVEGREIQTLMTRYTLGASGLPTQIRNTGEALLAAPMRLLEGGTPMKGVDLKIGTSHNVDIEWSSRMEGITCDVILRCRAEYDGLIRYELDVQPKQKSIAPLSLEIPVKKEHASHRLFQPCNTHTGVKVTRTDPAVYSPKLQALPSAIKHAKYKRKPVPTAEDFKAYAFWTQMDVTSRDRGIYWFADNAAGWSQSKSVDAQQFRLTDVAHVIVLNLVAETADYEDERPIVFGTLPHPARPVPKNQRYWNRAAAPDDPRAKNIYGATFYPWPKSPRVNGMHVFPDKGWEHAESCRESMHQTWAGYVTGYFSMGYFSCNTGAYDQWGWRNGTGSRVSLTKSMVDYTTYNMNEYIRRGIYDAIYLDDSYAVPCSGQNAVDYGQALRMPDGSIQPGMRLWDHRDLMKRWRNLFIQHGKRPMLLAHHTGHWMYAGMVFADSALDGEGRPTLTIRSSRDFIDGYPLTRFEILQNQKLWGISRFYMASIWEFGPLAKGDNPHPAWSWRMARSAQSMLAHLENPVSFVDQGGSVFAGYWKDVLACGVGDSAVPFVPWWKSSAYLTTEDMGTKTLTSLYNLPDSVILIISNRMRENRDIAVDLNLKALGLAGGTTVKAMDSAYLPPKGDDPYLLRKLIEQAEKMNLSDRVESLFDADGDDMELTLEEDDEGEKSDGSRILGSDPPSLTGSRLVVPTRARDFRVILLKK